MPYASKHGILLLVLVGLLGGYLVSPVNGQATSRSTRQLSLGRTAVALPGGGWQLWGNPAMMEAGPTRYTVHFNGIRNYGLKSLQEASAAATLSMFPGTVGFGMHHFGGDLYRELTFPAGFAAQWENVFLGISATYTHIAIKGYGSAGATGVNAGTAFKIGRGFWLGAAATNLNRPSPTAGEHLPSALSFGLTYNLASESLLTTEVVKTLDFPLSWRAGFEVKVVGPLKLRLGALTHPTAWTAGLGLSLKNVQIDLGVEHHQALGLSYGTGMGIRARGASPSEAGSRRSDAYSSK